MDRLQTLLDFHREDPDDPFVRFALAQEYRKAGDDARALDAYEALLRDRPDYVGAYYHLGKLYGALGREGEARRTFQRGIQAATAAGDPHARAELQSALLEAEGLGDDD